jgi:hypothetical protein
MTSDATHVYWIELNGLLHGVAKNGGTPFDASYVFGNPTELTVDATHLYWVIPGDGRVAVAPKPIGDARHLGSRCVIHHHRRDLRLLGERRKYRRHGSADESQPW